MLKKNLFAIFLFLLASSYPKQKKALYKSKGKCTTNACPVVAPSCATNSCPVSEIVTCETNACAAPIDCAQLPIDQHLGAKELARIEAHYRGMLTKAKENLDAASAARMKDLACQMESIANEKINCEIAALAEKERIIREMMCCELQQYAAELKKQECKALEAKAQTLATKINVEVKEAIRCAPKLDCDPCNS